LVGPDHGGGHLFRLKQIGAGVRNPDSRDPSPTGYWLTPGLIALAAHVRWCESPGVHGEIRLGIR